LTYAVTELPGAGTGNGAGAVTALSSSIANAAVDGAATDRPAAAKL
jgi:hypothetical protein